MDTTRWIWAALALTNLVLVSACGGSTGDDDGDDDGDDTATDIDAAPGAPDAGSGNALESTLTATCATLQGRAIVNENGNLGVSFTEPGGAFTFIGSVQWELPDGFTGNVANPENWDGSSARHVIAVTAPGSFETFGNHCWMNGAAPAQPGTASIVEYAPQAGLVRATFTNYVLHSCVGAATCTITGSIATTGEGVFE